MEACLNPFALAEFAMLYAKTFSVIMESVAMMEFEQGQLYWYWIETAQMYCTAGTAT